MKRMIFVLILLVLVGTGTNQGRRHETAAALTPAALAYYGADHSPARLEALADPGAEDPWDSPLRAALAELMRETGSAEVSYGDTIAYFSITDCSGDSQEPLLFYSDGTGPMVREQVWPRSRGVYYEDGPGRDLHHLHPADAGVDLARGSQTFGWVRDRLESWETCTRDGQEILWYQTDWNWGTGLVEVRDEVKGDVARVLLYVWTVYGDEDGGNRNLYTDEAPMGTGLAASDGLRVVESLDTLLDWCALDPVDTWELGRNDAVQAIQGNRNVYIDYPELAWLVFGREIPDHPTPSGWAHSLTYRLTARSLQPEWGTLTQAGRVVTAHPASGYVTGDWTLEPEGAAQVEREGDVFRVRDLKEDCALLVSFTPEPPCAAGHTWDEGRVTVEPTCAEPGIEIYTCRICGAEKESPLAALGHSWSREDSELPTCTEPGAIHFRCARCTASRTEPLPVLGHNWKGETHAPDCLNPGEKGRRCARCGLWEKTETLPALGHDWEEELHAPDCVNPGEKGRRCARCGLWEPMEVLPALGHDWEEELHAPDCINPGEKGRRCARCGLREALETLPALGHSWDSGVLTLSPTQTGPGQRAYTCQRCGAVRLEKVPFRFADVKDPALYYFVPVYWAVAQEPPITKGTDATHFSPGQTCTRAQVVTFLWRAAGAPTKGGGPVAFADVAPGDYFYEAVRWAVGRGITKGTSAACFSPDAPCTRAQVVTFLWRAAGAPKPRGETCPFRDVLPAAYYRKAVLWATEEGITKGTAQDAFSPEAACTRGQVVSFLHRWAQNP